MVKKILSHLDEYGNAKMVNISLKDETKRVAVSMGEIKMTRDTLSLIRNGSMKKGDVLTVAKIAGINAAKKTSELIPLCHPLFLTNIDMEFFLEENLPGILVKATVETIGRTGVEMEALVAVSTACLAIYDMAKSVEKTMVIQNIRLVEKHGGVSGDILNETSD